MKVLNNDALYQQLHTWKEVGWVALKVTLVFILVILGFLMAIGHLAWLIELHDWIVT